MSVEAKLESALSLLKEHNSVVGAENEVSTDGFIKCIKVAGGTTEERLKNFSYEDILTCMSVPMGTVLKPVALAKDIAKIFRGKEENQKEDKHVSVKKADKMSLRELVEHYDAEDSDNAVGKRLKEVSKGERFVVFSSGRTIDIETTLKLLQEIKQGYAGRNDITVNNEIKEVHAVGSLPDNFVDENPLYKGRPLRPDGTCDQTGRSWEGISQEVRQLIRVAMEVGELRDISIDKAHDILDIVMGDGAMMKLSARYRNARVKFLELQGTGQLPILKLVLKKGSNSPFDNAKKVNWNR